MEMFKCNDCAEVFYEPDIHHWEESREYGRSIVYEPLSEERCPYCGSVDFEEADKCEVCGEYYTDLYDGICEECYEDATGNYEKLEELSKTIQTKENRLGDGYINPLYLYVFGIDGIEQLCAKHVKEFKDQYKDEIKGFCLDWKSEIKEAVREGKMK